MALKPIQILINAKDEASSVFDSLAGKAKAVGAALAGYFGIRAFTGMVEGAADFEAAMSRVKAATGASAEEFATLKKAAEDAGANTKFTSSEAAGALENLAKAGLSANDAIQALPAVLQLAQAGGVDLGQASEYITKAVMGMGLAFEDAGRVADVLAKGANASNTSVEGLAQALSYTAPIAKSVGLNLESTVAIIGKFADAGIDASRAGTALNSILAQFSDPASKFRQQLLAIGISTGDFEKALNQLAAAGPRGASAILAVGQEAGPALRSLLNQGMGALDELRGKLNDAGGSAAETAKIMQDNLQGSMKGLSSVWDTFKNALAEPVLPVLRDAVDQLAASFKGAIADGSVGKFGASIAEAFRTAVQAVRDFVGQADFSAIGQRLQEFAVQAQDALARVGTYASNAGNVVQTAYGVMAAGVNGVLAAIYGIGSVFSDIAGTVMTGMAKLRDGLAAVTFGKLSESFRLAADDARSMAQGFGDAAQAMRDKAAAAMDDTARAAGLARDGFAGLAGAANASAAATKAGAAAVDSMATYLRAEAEASAAAAGATSKKAQADAKAKEDADKHRAAVADLQAQYQKQVALGNWQEAAELMVKLRGATEAAGQAAALTSKQIEMAAQGTAAQNTVIASGLKLKLAEEKAYEATAHAMGNEYAALQSKIRQKEIEIEIVQANAKAMADEAEASLRVARAQMAEAKASKEGITPELQAELEARIRLAEAKKIDAQAIEASVAGQQAELAAMRGAAIARDAQAAGLQQDTALRERNADAIDRQADAYGRLGGARRTADGFKANADGSAAGTLTNGLPVDQVFALIDKANAGKLGTGDLDAAKVAQQQAQAMLRYMNGVAASNPGLASPEGMAQARNNAARLNSIVSDLEQKARNTPTPGTPAPAPAPAAQPFAINLSIGGTSYGTVHTDAQGRAALASFVQVLEDEFRRQGAVH